MSKRFVTYDDIHELTTSMIDDLSQLGIDLIVGLGRGGNIPSTILSYVLDIPLVVVNYSSVKGRGESNHSLADSHGLIADIMDKNILIIDDMVDSGHTMQEFADICNGYANNITTAVLYYKDTSVFVPSIKASTLVNADEWLVFPWE